eukprot:8391321-Pyramimonas_sp.AAC.1
MYEEGGHANRAPSFFFALERYELIAEDPSNANHAKLSYPRAQPKCRPIPISQDTQTLCPLLTPSTMCVFHCSGHASYTFASMTVLRYCLAHSARALCNPTPRAASHDSQRVLANLMPAKAAGQNLKPQSATAPARAEDAQRTVSHPRDNNPAEECTDGSRGVTFLTGVAL